MYIPIYACVCVWGGGGGGSGGGGGGSGGGCGVCRFTAGQNNTSFSKTAFAHENEIHQDFGPPVTIKQSKYMSSMPPSVANVVEAPPNEGLQPATIAIQSDWCK